MNLILFQMSQQIGLMVLSTILSMWRSFVCVILFFVVISILQKWLEKKERIKLTSGLSESDMQAAMERLRKASIEPNKAPSINTLRRQYRQRLNRAARYRLNREEALRVKHEQYQQVTPQYARMIINNVRVGGGWASDSDISQIQDWASEDLSGDSEEALMSVDAQNLDDDWVEGLEDRD